MCQEKPSWSVRRRTAPAEDERRRCSPCKNLPRQKWQQCRGIGHTPCTNDRAYVQCSHPHTPTKTHERTQELTQPHAQPGSLVGVAHKVRHSLSQTDIAPGRKQHHCASASSRLSLPSSPSKWEYEMVSRCRQRYKPTTILLLLRPLRILPLPLPRPVRPQRFQPTSGNAKWTENGPGVVCIRRTPCVPQPQPDDAQGRGRCAPSTAHGIVTVVTLRGSWPTACNQRRNSYLRTCASAITKPRRLMRDARFVKDDRWCLPPPRIGVGKHSVNRPRDSSFGGKCHTFCTTASSLSSHHAVTRRKTTHSASTITVYDHGMTATITTPYQVRRPCDSNYDYDYYKTRDEESTNSQAHRCDNLIPDNEPSRAIASTEDELDDARCAAY